jgi:hypothetical protein
VATQHTPSDRITLPLRTALGLDDLPGEVPGLGIIPREVIARMIRTEQPKLRLLVIDPDDGRLVYRAEDSYGRPRTRSRRSAPPTCSPSDPAAKSSPPAATPTTPSLIQPDRR